MTRLLLSCMLLASAAHGAAQDAPALATAQHFFQQPTTLGASISPNGRFVALRITSDAGRAGLVVLDVATMKPSPVASYGNADVTRASWLNDKRLLFYLENVERGNAAGGPGLYAIDRSGGAPTALYPTGSQQQSFAANASFDSESQPSPFGALRSGIGEDELLITSASDGEYDMVRMDSRTGLAKFLGGPFDKMSVARNRTGRNTDLEGRDRAVEWLVDENGDMRVSGVIKGSQHELYYADKSKTWRKIASFDKHGTDSIEPVLFLKEKLYVLARNGGDTKAIYRFDLDKNAMEAEALIAAPGFDVIGHFIVADKKILGFHLFSETETTVWFDASMKAIQAEVDRMLPNTINHVERGERSETPYVLINAHSDSTPNIFYLMNTETKKLTQLGQAYATSNPGYAATRTQVRYKARDGMEIRAALTLPKVAVQKQLPMVVLASSRPWHRNGDWDWQPMVQFLAARGYAVLQPEPRGTDGYGARYAKAGHKQLGRAIQDDIADGVRWASAQGVADPARVCIAGTAYGGYAAVTGLIRDPDLFKCGVSWSGVADPGLSLEYQWKYREQDQIGMGSLFGEGEADAAILKSISPLEKPVKRPLLLAHGEHDRAVPLDHAERLRAVNPGAEWVTYAQKDRQWPLPANRIAFWTRVDAFLSRHIGPR